MTASLYRRLVDLPPGLLSRWPDARTTDEIVEAGVDPISLAEDIRRAAQERDLRVFVAVLSDGQASDIGTPALAKPGACERVVRRFETDAQKTPLRQRVKNYADDLAPKGPAAVVVCLWDGRIRSDVTHRRTRRDARFALDSDVHEWIASEAAKRGESKSAVVAAALRAEMGR